MFTDTTEMENASSSGSVHVVLNKWARCQPDQDIPRQAMEKFGPQYLQIMKQYGAVEFDLNDKVCCFSLFLDYDFPSFRMK
jgi:hypothetical protein